MDNGFKKYCPLIKRECLRERCEWWNANNKEEFSRCAINEISNMGYKLFRIMQMLEQGADTGFASRASGPGAAAARPVTPSTMPPLAPDDDFPDDFGDDPF